MAWSCATVDRRHADARQYSGGIQEPHVDGKGRRPAVLRGVDDKAYEDKLYSVVAFKDLNAAKPTKVAFDPKDDPGFPKGMSVSPDRAPMWRQDFSEVLFGIHEIRAKKPSATAAAEADGDTPAGPQQPAPPEDDKPSLVIWHYKDSRLQTQQQVQENADKNFSYLASYSPLDHKFVRLADDSVRQVTITPEQKFALGVDIREYEFSGSLDGRHFQDVYVVNPVTGERKLALRKSEHMMGASPDGRHPLLRATAFSRPTTWKRENCPN